MLIAGVSAFAVIKGGNAPENEFTPPPFEVAAQVGAPDNTESTYNFLEFPIFDNVCRVYIDANPSLNGNELKVLLTNYEKNNAWLRIELYNDDMKVIGESGIIRPGEYIENVALTESASSGDNIKIKLITYEPDTYYSLGSVNATIVVK